MSSAPGSMAGAGPFTSFYGQDIPHERMLSNCTNLAGNGNGMDHFIAQSYHDSSNAGSWLSDSHPMRQCAAQSMPGGSMFPRQLLDQFHYEADHIANTQDVHNYGPNNYDFTQSLLSNTYQGYEHAQIGGSNKARRPIDQKEWKDRKSILEQIYKKEGYSLKDTRAFMRNECGFDAPVNAYKEQFKGWGWRKNIPQPDKIQAIRFAMKRKREQNKNTEFWIGDEIFTVDRLRRNCKKLTRRVLDDTDPGKGHCNSDTLTDLFSDCELPSYMEAYTPETGSGSPSALSNTMTNSSPLRVAQHEGPSPTRNIEVHDNDVIYGTPDWRINPSKSNSNSTATYLEKGPDPAAVHPQGRTGSQSCFQNLGSDAEDSEHTPRSSYSSEEDEERRESKKMQLNHLQEISKNFDRLDDGRADNIPPDHVFDAPCQALLNEVGVGLYLDDLQSFGAAYAAIGRLSLYTRAPEATEMFSSLMDFGEILLFDSTHDLVLVLILTGRLVEIREGWTIAGGYFGKALSVLLNKYRQTRNEAVKFVEAICIQKSSQEWRKDALLPRASSCVLLNSMRELLGGNISVQNIDAFLSRLTFGGLQDGRSIFAKLGH